MTTPPGRSPEAGMGKFHSWMAKDGHIFSKEFVECADFIVSKGFRLSAASWEDEDYAYACSVENWGPAYYCHPKCEKRIDKNRRRLEESKNESQAERHL